MQQLTKEKLSFIFAVIALFVVLMPFSPYPFSAFPLLICFLLFLFFYAAGLILYRAKPITGSRMEIVTAVLLILESLPILFVVGGWILLTLSDGPLSTLR